MKFFRKTMLLLGETAAIGWFMLKDISYVALLPLVPLGLLYCCLMHRDLHFKWLNGISAALSLAVTALTVGRGIFDGHGVLCLAFLLLAVGLLGLRMPRGELMRISGWWLSAFAVVFTAMFIATLPGIRLRDAFPPMGDWIDILIFYLLAFLEPFSMGRDYRSAPLALGVLLIPFAIVSFMALGEGAYGMAEYPYLSVWSGVALSAFHHTEGIILSLYCGFGALRVAHFFAQFRKMPCNRQGQMV